MDVDDKNWTDVFSTAELDETRSKCTEKDTTISSLKKKGGGDFLDTIPQSTNAVGIFNFANALFIDPAVNRSLYWLKMTLQQVADLFITKHLPVTDHTKRDIMRQVCGFIDTSFDGSILKCQR